MILADGNGAATGDLVRARLNTHLDAAGQPLSNRDTLRLVGWAGAGETRVAIVQRQLSGGAWSREFPVPADYLRKSAELAYAGNVYVAQGRTVDTAHLYVSPTLTRETLYVGMTRAREANTAHVVTGPAQAPGQEPIGPSRTRGRPGRHHGPRGVQHHSHRGHARGSGVRHQHPPPVHHVERCQPGPGVHGHRRGPGRAALPI